MKALSIRHPFIDAILAGTKTVEVRSRPTRHRGTILLHASRTFARREREELEHFRQAGLSIPDPDPASFGVVLGTAELVGCHLMEEGDWKHALAEPSDGTLWAWELREPHAITPFPLVGHLGLYEVEEALLPTSVA